VRGGADVAHRERRRVDTLQPGDRAALVKEPRRVGTVVELRDADHVVWREDGQVAKIVAPSRLKAVEADSGLVVVPMGRVPTTPAELLATMTGHTSTFAGSPTPGNAKKWVKAALMHVGVEGASLSARTVDDGSGPRVAVRIVLPAASAGSAEVERKLRIVDGALGRKGAPRIGLEGWSYGGEEVRSASREPTAPAEQEVDAAKDKALIDAFSAAVAAAMRG
jgi:hypothetical protein